MRETIKTRDGRTIVLNTLEEDQEIIKAALTDPDALPLTDEDIAKIEAQLRQRRAARAVGK